MFTRLQSKHIFLTKYGILILKIIKILARNAKNKYKKLLYLNIYTLLCYR